MNGNNKIEIVDFVGRYMSYKVDGYTDKQIAKFMHISSRTLQRRKVEHNIRHKYVKETIYEMS